MTISIQNLSFSYSKDTPPLIEKLSITINESSWVAIIGEDGSGKSTLGKLLNGLLKPSNGSIVNDAENSSSIGYLGGDPYDSFVGLSVEEDVVFEMENKNVPPDEMSVRLNQALIWTGLVGFEKRLVSTLSGGEQQKLALASALAAGAEVLILDDAMDMLDRAERLSIRSLLVRLRHDQALTIIEITNNLEEALTTDRILFLSAGGVQFYGSAAEFITNAIGTKWIYLRGGMPALKRKLLEHGVIAAYPYDDNNFLNSLLKYFNK